MSFADIRREVANVLNSVKGIGEVHEFRRHSTDWEKIFKRHVKNGQLNNWEISRSSVAQEIDNVQGAIGNEPLFQDAHLVVIVGHLVLNDAKQTEKTFQDLIDEVKRKFRTNLLLKNAGGETPTVLLPITVQVPIIDHRMFGGTLVHFAQMTILAVERVGG